MNRYEEVAGALISYDLRGNTLSDGTNSYGYDIFDRQVSMSNPGDDAEYIYDALGRRIAKVVNGAMTTYIYDKRYRVIEERAGDGSLEARYTYGTGVDEPLMMERDGNVYYYHRDALGNITEVTDSSGLLAERYTYDVYGSPQIFDGSGTSLASSVIGNPYLFTSRRYDLESGNYYFRARIYHPALGRFLQMDPAGNVDGMNRYNAYFVMKGTDPYGLAAQSVSLNHLGCDLTESGGACGYLLGFDLDLWFAKASIQIGLQVSYAATPDTRSQCTNIWGPISLWGYPSQNVTQERYTLSLTGGFYGATSAGELTFDLWFEAKLNTSGLETNFGYSVKAYIVADGKIWLSEYCGCYQVTAQVSPSVQFTVHPVRAAVVALAIATAAAAPSAIASLVNYSVGAVQAIEAAMAAAYGYIRLVPGV
jgi:RHS repeat-associated protein